MMHEFIITSKIFTLWLIGALLAWLDIDIFLAINVPVNSDIETWILWLDLIGKCLSVVFVALAIYFLFKGKMSGGFGGFIKDKLTDINL